MPKLTLKTVPALPGPAPGKFDVIHWDDELPGFGLRILRSGTRSWVARYRIGKRQRVVTIAKAGALSPEKARQEAGKVLAKAKIGQDTRVELVKARADASDTFGALARAYLTRQVKPNRRASYAREVERYLLQDAKPLLALPLDSIDRKRIARLLAEIAERGPVAADRCRAALSACLAWGMRHGLADANPTIGTGRAVAASEIARDRVLDNAEIASLWAATSGEGDYLTILRLLLLTGQRREEVAGMAWKEVDLERSLWMIPAERTKNRRKHEVPLSPAALACLQARHVVDGRALVFGRGAGGFSGWSQAKRRLDLAIARARCEAAGLAAPDAGTLDAHALQAWRVHDIRRTVVTGMAEIGVQPHIVEAVVNHVSGHKAGVAGVYNHAAYAAEKRAALQAWADHLLAIVDDSPPKVVMLDRARA